MLKKPASLAFARHSRLTISAAFTNVPRLIRRDVNLRGSTYGLGKRLFTQAMGWAGEKSVRIAFSDTERSPTRARPQT
jgi:hypothetical protein